MNEEEENSDDKMNEMVSRNFQPALCGAYNLMTI